MYFLYLYQVNVWYILRCFEIELYIKKGKKTDEMEDTEHEIGVSADKKSSHRDDKTKNKQTGTTSILNRNDTENFCSRILTSDVIATYQRFSVIDRGVSVILLCRELFVPTCPTW